MIVEADGGSRGNPGPAGYGAVVRDAASGAVLAERKDGLGVTTNNVAEYRGLIAGLEAARHVGATEVAVRMDSRLVVEQMLGRWQVKHPSMRPLAGEAAALVREFAAVTFEWVPREANKYADRLANEAMDAAATREVRRKHPSASGTAPAAAPSWTPPSGPPTRLLLARHGATAHSGEMRFSGRNELPLNEAGQQQAAALARRLADWPDIAAVVTSPLVRTRQTAEVIATTLRLTVVENQDLAEVDFGRWEGLTMREAATAFPDEMRQWAAAPDTAPPGGESFASLARRVRRARDAIITAQPDRTVVVVSHVSPIKTLVRLALDAPPTALFRLHLDPGSLSVIDYYANGDARVSLFNDTAHLTR